MKKIISKVICGAMLLAAVIADGKELKLTDNGKILCKIEFSKAPDEVEKHASKEFCTFLAKISKTEKKYSSSPDAVKIKFVINEKDPALKKEGYRLSVSSKGIVITAKRSIGFLYALYGILRDHGGMRWLFPGEDGEYYSCKKSIKVPFGTSLHNPTFNFRTIHSAYAAINSEKWATFDWMVRNNMRIYDTYNVLNYPKLKKGLIDRGAVTLNGGHCFTRLVNGIHVERNGKESGQYLRKLYQEKKEYFPLINGKRVYLDGQKYQPCTSNKEVISLMSENARKWIRKFSTRDGIWEMSNNDGTGWCQCENCKKIDTAYDKKHGYLTTRYWTAINEIANECFKEKADAEVWGIAYQNFQAPPKDIMPDKRLSVLLAFNRRCFRHKIGDKNCLTNPLYLSWFKGWFKLGFRHTTWEQLDSAAGYHFLPIEDVFYDTLCFYKKNNMDGCWIELPPPDGKYSKRHKGSMVKDCWRAMWQTMYCAANLMWNMDQSYEKLYEEANTLFYGKGWEGGMKEFRKLLIKTSQSTPGCFGHGHSSPLGRCLDAPGVQEKLLALLDQAEKAAAKDPDKRALKHVQKDKELFRRTWLKTREEYINNYREVRAYKKSAPIKIDGNITEKDWQNADIVSSFKLCNGKGLASNQTYVRTVYEPENIYFAIEAMEKEPSKMVSNVTQKDGAVWEDNTLEIFISHPDMGNRFYHLIVNNKGVLFDAVRTPGSPMDQSFDSEAEIATKVLKDRWVLEIRIPSAPLGEKCMEGESWKVNIGRRRFLSNKVTENSTWSNGYPHDVGKFHPVAFCRDRKVIGNARAEADARGWKNGSFQEAGKRRFPPKWETPDGIFPKDWIFPGKGKAALKEEQNGNRYLEISQGRIIQNYDAPGKKLKINFRVRGKGKLLLAAYRYTRPAKNVKRKQIGGKNIKTFTLNSDKWQYIKEVFERPTDNETTGIAFVHLDGSVSIDDVFVSREQK